MEIGTMSAAEFAESFANQNQPLAAPNNPNPAPANPDPNNPPAPAPIGGKSSEELAAEAEAIKGNGDKTPEELAAEAEAKKNGAGRPKTKLDDNFKQGLDKLFKEQKLDPYSDGTATGYVVPETWEDVVELIDENKKNWVESNKAKDREELYNELLATKSPAWQFIIQNAETYRDPAELVPLLTAVQNQEYSANLDPLVEEDQISIIRAALSIQQLPPTDIESEIEDLKERGKMAARAASLKPVLDRYNEAQTDRVLQEKQASDLQKSNFWNSYYQNMEDNIFKAKEIDGVKLKNEHKQLIASTLVPDEKLGGLPIYTIIDNLVAAGDFKRLSKIALMSLDEKLFDSYFLTKKADKVADGVQRVLRQSGTSSGPTDFEAEDRPKPIKKSQYGYFG